VGGTTERLLAMSFGRFRLDDEQFGESGVVEHALLPFGIAAVALAFRQFLFRGRALVRG
jgi:hypothetical protein